MVVNKMKATEIRKMSTAELESKLADLKKDLFTLSMQNATNQLDNPLQIAAVKKGLPESKLFCVKRSLGPKSMEVSYYE